LKGKAVKGCLCIGSGHRSWIFMAAALTWLSWIYKHTHKHKLLQLHRTMIRTLTQGIILYNKVQREKNERVVKLN